MLEKLPAGIGRALREVRAGLEKVVVHDARFADVATTFRLTGADFVDEAAMPPDCTADGSGKSPVISWRDVPATATSIALIVEDADSPTPHPLVHAIAWNLQAEDGTLARGALHDPADGAAVVALGKNSYLQQAWLPPDPPPGHGPHRYVFQLFALDRMLKLDGPPGRSALLEAMQGHVVATAVLVGTYERR